MRSFANGDAVSFQPTGATAHAITASEYAVMLAPGLVDYVCLNRSEMEPIDERRFDAPQRTRAS